MPMTAAHPMAVLPFVRTRLDWTCLVIGSMSPDFEYFIRADLASTVSHTLPGLFYFCLPATLIAAALFHYLVKLPALRVAPAPLARRLAGFAERPWMPAWTVRAVVVLVVSALIGGATHLFWDGITHGDGWAPHRYRALVQIVDVPILGHMIVHRVIQHVSTAIGLLVLAAALGITLARAKPQPVETAPWRVRLVWLVCIAAVGALTFLHLRHMHLWDPGSIVVAVIDAFLGGALLASLFTR
jgi:uncharacterized protein DUF4184